MSPHTFTCSLCAREAPPSCPVWLCLPEALGRYGSLRIRVISRLCSLTRPFWGVQSRTVSKVGGVTGAVSCVADDKDLPSVPPLEFSVPADYPAQSPLWIDRQWQYGR